MKRDIKDEIELISLIKNKVSGRNGWLFNLYISGSDLYGWKSKDSDTDYRGCYVLRSDEFLGLSTPNEVLEINEIVDKDIVLFEIKKMAHLALKGNCNILEEINAPQLYKTAQFLKFRQLINNAFGKNGIYGSYKGLAEFNYKKFILSGKNTVKKYLYVFRGLMAGIYVLQTGVIQPNIEILNKNFKIKEVDKLVEIKKAGLESEPLKEIDEGILDNPIKDLFEKLDEAYIKSKIPEKPAEEDIAKINEFLIELRK